MLPLFGSLDLDAHPEVGVGREALPVLLGQARREVGVSAAEELPLPRPRAGLLGAALGPAQTDEVAEPSRHLPAVNVPEDTHGGRDGGLDGRRLDLELGGEGRLGGLLDFALPLGRESERNARIDVNELHGPSFPLSEGSEILVPRIENYLALYHSLTIMSILILSF